MTEIYASGVIYGGLELVWGILGYFSGDYWYTSEVEVESSHVDPSGVDGCETWLQNGEMSTAVDLRNKKIIGWDYQVLQKGSMERQDQGSVDRKVSRVV